MLSDIEIAESVKLLPISDVAKKLGLYGDDLDVFGKYKAKITKKGKKDGKLILVTAINPTASGEGKTTVSIGLADSMAAEGVNVCLALREPSLGPVFGMKGGATGGGFAQIAPMSDINLHFNGDLHAITAANNLLASMIDNHIFQGNVKKIARVTWRRCLDCNDRALRDIIIGIGFKSANIVRSDGFDITAASEIMAILCLADDLADLKKRLDNIVIGYDYNNLPVQASDIGAADALTILLRDAMKPNLVQTLEGTPALVHGGPFANIAHGCNTVVATKTALSHADYCITEAGFGADLGAEKFLDIKCRVAGLKPSCVVIVATVRALKSAGGIIKEELGKENVESMLLGAANLDKHIENMAKFGLSTVVAINKFVTDTAAEIDALIVHCKAVGAEVVPCEIWAKGSKGGKELAETVIGVVERSKPTEPKFIYSLDDSLDVKIDKVAKEIYGATTVKLLPAAVKQIAEITKLGGGNLPICIAKTQYSLSDNPSLIGRPKDFTVTVKEVQWRAGAGFVVVVAGEIMLMPGLPKVPNAVNMTIDNNGTISGLY